VLLKANNISKSFGGIHAVADVSFEVGRGEIVGLIGPNGAGKTTIFNLLTGFTPLDKGEILFNGKNITGLQPDRIAHEGLVRTFQSTEYLYFGYSVFENILMARHILFKKGILSHLLRSSAAKQEETQIEKEALESLDFVGLNGEENSLAENLPHGKQRVLGVAIGLSTKPQLLLLDEPMTGMNPHETAFMTEVVNKIREKGITVMMIEHDMRSVMKICDRIVVVNFGKKICEGDSRSVRENPDVIEAYLGKKNGTHTN